MYKCIKWIINKPNFIVGIISQIMAITFIGAIVSLIYGATILGTILICLVGFWVFVIIVIACITNKYTQTHNEVENKVEIDI